MKDDFIKVRAEAERKARWKTVAEERKQTLAAFVIAAVEAAIIGKIDQATLDRHLRSIRRDSNAAYEAVTLEEARGHIDVMLQKIAALRGGFEK